MKIVGVIANRDAYRAFRVVLRPTGEVKEAEFLTQTHPKGIFYKFKKPGTLVLYVQNFSSEVLHNLGSLLIPETPEEESQLIKMGAGRVAQ